MKTGMYNEGVCGRSMKKVQILRIVIAILIIIDASVIFFFSAQKAEQSSTTSSGVIEQIAKVIYKDFDRWPQAKQNAKIESLQHLVRKCAHMTEYASLGVLSAAFALTFGSAAKNQGAALLFCALYASSDEFHQKFVEGRSCQLSDVLIDSCGALVGIAAFCLVTFIFTRILTHCKRKED